MEFLMEDLKNIKSIDDYCQYVRSQLADENLSFEQIKGLFAIFTCFTQGYLASCETKIDYLTRSVKEYKARLEYIQGNNDVYASGINELEEKFLKYFASEREQLVALSKSEGLGYIGNAFKLEFEKISSFVAKCFFEYLYNEKQPTNTQQKGGESNEKE